MAITGKIFTICIKCGHEHIIETTPYEAFKRFTTIGGYTMMYCPKCKEKHMHHYKPEDI